MRSRGKTGPGALGKQIKSLSCQVFKSSVEALFSPERHVINKKMKKKRSIGIIILSVYLLLAGIISFIPHSEPIFTKGIAIILGLVSIICAIALFFLLPWGRKTTIFLMVISILYSFIYYSPIYHEQRTQHFESDYQRILNDERNVSYSINDNEVTKEEFLVYKRQKIEKYNDKGFDIPMLIYSLALEGLILLFLFKKSIKQQFLKENL
jgi:hypothetical protein